MCFHGRRSLSGFGLVRLCSVSRVLLRLTSGRNLRKPTSMRCPIIRCGVFWYLPRRIPGSNNCQWTSTFVQVSRGCLLRAGHARPLQIRLLLVLARIVQPFAGAELSFFACPTSFDSRMHEYWPRAIARPRPPAHRPAPWAIQVVRLRKTSRMALRRFRCIPLRRCVPRS